MTSKNASLRFLGGLLFRSDGSGPVRHRQVGISTPASLEHADKAEGHRLYQGTARSLIVLVGTISLWGAGCGKSNLRPVEVVDRGPAAELVTVEASGSDVGDGQESEAAISGDEAVLAEAIERGHDAFYTYGCWHCHALGDEEPPGMRNDFAMGPDLADVGSRLSLEEILRELKRPNDVIAEPRDLHVEDGVSKMPAFADPLAEADVRDIALFLSQNRQPVAADPGIIEITDETYSDVVEATEEPLLVYFWAEWCFRCLALSPALEEVAPDYRGRLKIGKIEVDQNPHLVEALVPDQMFPCMVLVKDGEVVERKYATDPDVEPAAFFRQWFDGVLR